MLWAPCHVKTTSREPSDYMNEIDEDRERRPKEEEMSMRGVRWKKRRKDGGYLCSGQWQDDSLDECFHCELHLLALQPGPRVDNCWVA